MDTLELRLIRDPLAVVRLEPTDAVPDWVTGGTFVSVTRTRDELSIVCAAEAVPSGVVSVGPWRAFVVTGPLDFEMVGVLVRIASILAAAEIPLLSISTHDTDWVLVRENRAADARTALAAGGIAVHRDPP